MLLDTEAADEAAFDDLLKQGEDLLCTLGGRRADHRTNGEEHRREKDACCRRSSARASIASDECSSTLPTSTLQGVEVGSVEEHSWLGAEGPNTCVDVHFAVHKP